MALRLANFILRDMDAILAQWERFAASLLPAARSMDSLALRDHAVEILEAIALDLQQPQSREEQSDKSMGLILRAENAPATAAQTHAMLRARSGFDVKQLAAEYRALRESVLRSWMDDCAVGPMYLYDVMRFNEAIDQALAESIASFTAQVERSRNLFLGMLGHDMRSPLQSIQLTATYLSALHAGEQVSDAARRLIHSGARMHELLDDLLDFNRTQLGLGLPVNPAPVDLASLCAEEVDEIRSAYPGRQVTLRCECDGKGHWDGRRLRQLIGNLIVNAIKYGDGVSPVRVSVTGDPREVFIEVANNGDPIDPAKSRDFLTRLPEAWHSNQAKTAVSA